MVYHPKKHHLSPRYASGENGARNEKVGSVHAGSGISSRIAKCSPAGVAKPPGDGRGMLGVFRQGLFEHFWDIRELEILELEPWSLWSFGVSHILMILMFNFCLDHLDLMNMSGFIEAGYIQCSHLWTCRSTVQLLHYFQCWWWKMRKVLIPNHSRQCFGYQYLRMEL